MKIDDILKKADRFEKMTLGLSKFAQEAAVTPEEVSSPGSSAFVDVSGLTDALNQVGPELKNQLAPAVQSLTRLVGAKDEASRSQLRAVIQDMFQEVKNYRLANPGDAEKADKVSQVLVSLMPWGKTQSPKPTSQPTQTNPSAPLSAEVSKRLRSRAMNAMSNCRADLSDAVACKMNGDVEGLKAAVGMLNNEVTTLVTIWDNFSRPNRTDEEVAVRNSISNLFKEIKTKLGSDSKLVTSLTKSMVGAIHGFA